MKCPVLAGVFILALSAVSSASVPQPVTAGGETAYQRIAPGDWLLIEIADLEAPGAVWGRLRQVDEHGQIHAVLGSVAAAGRTEAQIGQAVHSQLRSRLCFNGSSFTVRRVPQ